jgi:hypothetical protein
MEPYPDIFVVSKKGTYICACDAWIYDIEEAHDHFNQGEIEGFCVNGIRRNHKIADIQKDEYECVCGKKCDRYEMSVNHYGVFKKSCMTARIRKQNSYCGVCDLQFGSVYDLNVHVNSKKHQRSEIGMDIIPLRCDACNIKCVSQPQIRQHLETKKHKDMVASGKVAEEIIPLECDVCNIKCPSQKTMRAHLETKKHKKLLSINNISQRIDAQKTNKGYNIAS